jgi:hypothetical protein
LRRLASLPVIQENTLADLAIPLGGVGTASGGAVMGVVNRITIDADMDAQPAGSSSSLEGYPPAAVFKIGGRVTHPCAPGRNSSPCGAGAKEARAAGKRGRRPRPPAWWRRSASRGPSHLNPHPRSSSVITPIFELPLRLAEAADGSTSGAVDHSTCAARALACGASANSADPPVRGRLPIAQWSGSG